MDLRTISILFLLVLLFLSPTDPAPDPANFQKPSDSALGKSSIGVSALCSLGASVGGTLAHLSSAQNLRS